MDIEDPSRRALLQAIALTLGAAALPANWVEAAQHAGHAAAAAGERTITFFTAAEAADVEAITAQIIPTDDTPGAREAGAVYFIDRALATFFSQLGSDYRTQLGQFQAGCQTARGAAFAALTSEQQIAHLKTVDRTPFFEMTRLLTMFGLFSSPAYGGNRDGIGWKLIGFEDQHSFYPPFGHYDRDYPGFVIEPARSQA
jgi:gluconate 2-dehydrogenase gamma chain